MASSSSSSEEGDSDTSDKTAKRRRRRRLESEEELRARFTLEERARRAIVREDWLGSEEVREIRDKHAEAVDNFKLSYDDPATGLKVLTAWNHFLRDRCCGSACRHCIYGHQAVPVDKKRGWGKVFNSVFWENKKDP